MNTLRKVVWWVALPLRCTLTVFVALIAFPLFPYDDNLPLLIKELWAKP
jgi:hypothetical protein